MKKIMLFMAILSILAFVSNAPAPYWPCAGMKEGDPCKRGYGCGSKGKCVLIKECKDDPATSVNECLHCQK